MELTFLNIAIYGIAVVSMGSYTLGFSAPPLRARQPSLLRLSIGVDPNDVASYHDSISIESISTVLAAKTGGWSFLWFHGGAAHGPAQSIPPLDSDGAAAISTMKDYFLPTSSDEVTGKALEAADQLEKQGNVIYSADFMELNQVMPGIKGSFSSSPAIPANVYQETEEISKRELEWYARSADLFTRRLPTAIAVFALLDFFVLPNQPDLLNEEMEDDRVGVARQWLGGASIRFGVLLGVIFLTMFCENVFYHPL